jgi:chromosome segregation ATPase
MSEYEIQQLQTANTRLRLQLSHKEKEVAELKATIETITNARSEQIEMLNEILNGKSDALKAATEALEAGNIKWTRAANILRKLAETELPDPAGELVQRALDSIT